MSQSDETREVTFATAAGVASLVEERYADLGVRVVHFPEAEDRWTECSDDVAADTEVPEAIQWTTSWTLAFDVSRETASLIDELSEHYVAEGWERGDELNMDGGGRSVPFRKDGYVMRLGGVTVADPERASSLGVTVTGPCIPAPQDIRDWEPTT